MQVIVTQMVLGIIFVYGSFSIYTQFLRPPQPPRVTSTVQMYISDPSIPAFLNVGFSQAGSASDRTPVRIALSFIGPQRVPSVAWALVFYGDACIAERGACLRSAASATDTQLPPGAQVRIVRIAGTPFSANRKDQTAQVIWGTTGLDTASGVAGASIIQGNIPARVSSNSGPTSALSLPSYGRLPVSPLFDFPNRPGALDLSIPGGWRRPQTFQVDVDAGGNDSNHRVDVASPPLVDPVHLHWASADAVRAVLQRTDLQRQASQQVLVFLLGAAVGAGASSVLTVLEFLISRLWLRVARAWR
jgi:hypothetical protein